MYYYRHFLLKGLIFGTSEVNEYKRQVGVNSSEGASDFSIQTIEKVDLCESSELHYTTLPSNVVQDEIRGTQSYNEKDNDNSDLRKGAKTAVDIDEQILLEKIELIQVVYPTYKLLGWYTTGTYIRSEYYDIHKFIEGFVKSTGKENNCPLLMLLLDVESSSCFTASSKSMGNTDAVQHSSSSNVMKGVNKVDKEEKKMNHNVIVYEGIHHINGNKSSFSFAPLDFTYSTFASERISIEHVVRQQPKDPGISSTALYLSHIEMSLSTLVRKIQTIVSYLSALNEDEKNSLPSTLVRQIAALTSLLPSIENQIEETKELDDMQTIDIVSSVKNNNREKKRIGRVIGERGDPLSIRFWSEYNDTLATTLLASASKLTASVAEAVDLYQGIVGVFPSSLSNSSNDAVDSISLSRAPQYHNFPQRGGSKYNVNMGGTNFPKPTMDTFGMDIGSMNLLGQKREEETPLGFSMDYTRGSRKSGRKTAY